MKVRKLTYGIAGCIIVPFVGFVASLSLSSSHYQGLDKIDDGVQLRSLPYPFKAAYTISSDIDGTGSLEEFLTIQEYLNTRNTTRFGPGLGLEIGNSFFPISSQSPAFDSENEGEREVITDLIRYGYIDSIHSFNSATERNEMLRLSRLLEDCDCQIPVWINHTIVSNNLGAGSTSYGDNPKSSFYHADFSKKILKYDFVWEGAVSGIIGQGRPLDLMSFFEVVDRDNIIQTGYQNFSKEVAKYLFSYTGGKYSSRSNNELVFPGTLDDGQKVFYFVRSSITPKDLGRAANSVGLADSLRESVLDKLVQRNGFTIIYTHLGKNSELEYIADETRDGLERLAKRHQKGDIYVTTAARLLRYYVNRRYLHWHVESDRGYKLIYIDRISDPVRGDFLPTIDDLAGVTFYVNDSVHSQIIFKGEAVDSVIRNGPDHTGRSSIMIPISPLPVIDEKMLEYKEKGYF